MRAEASSSLSCDEAPQGRDRFKTKTPYEELLDVNRIGGLGFGKEVTFHCKYNSYSETSIFGSGVHDAKYDLLIHLLLCLPTLEIPKAKLDNKISHRC